MYTHLWQLLGKTIGEAKVWLQGYKTYKVVLEQTGTAAPVVIKELENSLGLKVEYQHNGIGTYSAIIDNLLFQSYTLTYDGRFVEVFMSPSIFNSTTETYDLNASILNSNVIGITANKDFINPSDGILTNNYYLAILEIRVYNN